MYSFSYLEPVCCSMSSYCCFLTCIQVSQEAVQVVWYSHLFQNFPQFIVIHTVQGFGIVNKAEIDVFSGTLLVKTVLPNPLKNSNIIQNIQNRLLWYWDDPRENDPTDKCQTPWPISASPFVYHKRPIPVRNVLAMANSYKPNSLQLF